MEETSASERQALGSEPANQMLGTVETNSTDGLGEGSITQIVRRLNAETFTYFVGCTTLSREWKRGILCRDEKERVDLCVGEKEKERDRIWVVGH